MAMLKLGEKIVSARVVILILSLVLLIPAAYGYIKTKVNYDILSYLPKDIETMKGQIYWLTSSVQEPSHCMW